MVGGGGAIKNKLLSVVEMRYFITTNFKCIYLNKNVTFSSSSPFTSCDISESFPILSELLFSREFDLFVTAVDSGDS